MCLRAEKVSKDKSVLKKYLPKYILTLFGSTAGTMKSVNICLSENNVLGVQNLHVDR